MRHVIATIGVLGAIFSAFVVHTVTPPTEANHGAGVYLVNLIWGLYYGIGFEPAFVWYKIHGPFPTGFLDVFAMIIYPIIASIFLYVVILRLSERPSKRKWILLALGLSFLVIVPMPYLTADKSWMLPIWTFGTMGEPP